MTISCVVPVILSLSCKLVDVLDRNTVFSTLVKTLMQGLHDRFHDIYSRLGIPRPRELSAFDARWQLNFDDDLFLMAASLDPNYAYHWLQDHPGSVVENKQFD